MKKTIKLFVTKKNWIVIFLAPLLFLVVGLKTLSDYGMNWDEPYHFMRGQAYLHYFLSGSKDYTNLPPYPRLTKECPEKVKNCGISPLGPFDVTSYQGNITYEDAVLRNVPKDQKIWRSYYQHDNYTFNEFIKTEDGHPPLGGILASLTNKIFYQYLKVLKDIESYHLFEVFISFTIVAGVSIFVYKNYGVFSALVAGTALATYPLFFAESHFNIKDPVLAAFFGLALITFYFALGRNSWRLLIISAVFSGFAMGVKFNIVFLPLIVGPWLILHLFNSFWEQKKKIKSIADLRKIIPARIAICLLIYPFVTLLVFYVLWPFLWPNPVDNFLKILTFYKQIGTGTPPELRSYLVRGWNTYPALWILYTTPIPILVLSLVGLIGAAGDFVFRRRVIIILLSFWFFVPIFRVSYPGTSIYGGVRQIMEYIPALAVLAGVGAYYMVRLFKGTRSKRVVQLVILASLVFVVSEMVRIHPNENVYFNQLVGGLSGAKKMDIPYWGNSYGNAYRQGIKWLNANAEPDAKIGLPLSTAGNISRLELRPDILFYNANWSGPYRKGEYEIELDFDWPLKEIYSYAYYDTFLEPVFEVKVHGVPLLKVWKNDLAHTKSGFEKEKEYLPNKVNTEKGVLNIDLGKEISLTRVLIKHSIVNCAQQKNTGYVATSLNGIDWQKEPDPIFTPQVPVTVANWEDTFDFFFPSRRARYILIDTQMDKSCILKNPVIKIQGLFSS